MVEEQKGDAEQTANDNLNAAATILSAVTTGAAEGAIGTSVGTGGCCGCDGCGYGNCCDCNGCDCNGCDCNIFDCCCGCICKCLAAIFSSGSPS